LEAEGALGLGQAELATLIWADVDMKLMQISVRRVKTGEPFTVPIYPQAKSLIERRKKITGEKEVAEAGRSWSRISRHTAARIKSTTIAFMSLFHPPGSSNTN
jgi:integrase